MKLNPSTRRQADFIPAGNFIIEDGFIPSERTDLTEKLQANGLEFFMAPLVGLEPTTCGLTVHETQSQRAKQSIKNRDRSSVFGDHPATRLIKQPLAKMASSPVSVPILPNSPGRFLRTGKRVEKIQYLNRQAKE